MQGSVDDGTPDATTGRHYVLVVHGTFTRRDPDRPQWFQRNPGDPTNFCERLAAHFVGTPLEGAVWRQCSSVTESDFGWTGENTHAARIEAADDLADRINEIIRSDPDARIHLIGHSHGGNVILKAVDQYITRQKAFARRLARDLSKAAGQVDATADDVVRLALTGAPEMALSAGRTADLRAVAQSLVEQRSSTNGRDYSRERWPWSSRPRHLIFGRINGDFVRQRELDREIELRLMFSPTWNHLGRLVFLGTPFYHKRWIRPNKLEHLLRIIRDSTPLAALLFLFYYLVVLFWWFILSLTTLVSSPSWNPLEWPLWISIPLAVLVVMAGFVVTVTETVENDTDLYFDEWAHKELWETVVEPVEDGAYLTERPSPIESLVITSPHLDEAILGLGAEPLVFAALVPQVHGLLTLRPEWSLPAPSSGVDTDALTYWGRQTVSWPFWMALNAIRAMVSWPWRFAQSVFIEPMLTGLVLRVVASAAFGVRASEFSGSHVTTGDVPAITSALRVTRWDVTEEFLTGAASPHGQVSGEPDRARAAQDLRDRYAFLIDDEALTLRIKKASRSAEGHDSSLWDRLSESIPDIARSRGIPESDVFVRHMARTWFAVEERLKEVSGSVDLNHSRYYASEPIVSRIADFIIACEEVTTRPPSA